MYSDSEKLNTYPAQSKNGGAASNEPKIRRLKLKSKLEAYKITNADTCQIYDKHEMVPQYQIKCRRSIGAVRAELDMSFYYRPVENSKGRNGNSDPCPKSADNSSNLNVSDANDKHNFIKDTTASISSFKEDSSSSTTHTSSTSKPSTNTDTRGCTSKSSTITKTPAESKPRADKCSKLNVRDAKDKNDFISDMTASFASFNQDEDSSSSTIHTPCTSKASRNDTRGRKSTSSTTLKPTAESKPRQINSIRNNDEAISLTRRKKSSPHHRDRDKNFKLPGIIKSPRYSPSNGEGLSSSCRELTDGKEEVDERLIKSMTDLDAQGWTGSVDFNSVQFRKNVEIYRYKL